MKKFLLSMALVLLSGATMAQTVVTTINTNMKYTLECRSGYAHNTTRFIGITDQGIIDGCSSTPVFVTFENGDADNSYYIKIGEMYINYNGTNLSANTEKSTAWVLGTVGQTVTFKYPDATKYLNNNGTSCADGSITHLQANNHTNGPNADNACSTWQMTEYTGPYTLSQITASDLMDKTEPTCIVMKNLSRRNPDWYAGTSSNTVITRANIFVWEPTDNGFRLKNLEGQYIQNGESDTNISFGTVDNAAVFTAVKPYVGGTGTAAMDHDNDSNPYITSDQDENLVRFVNEKNVWINVQNTDGTPGTPKYNTGKGGWTIQYVYELTMVESYDIEITDAKYATFYATSESVAPEDVTVYYATTEGIESEKINLREIENKIIPANTAVILYSETAGTYEFAASITNAGAINDNILKGTPISTNITEDAYVLGNENSVGLYKAQTTDVSTSGGTFKVFLNNANKAYLPVSALPADAAQSASLRFDFGGTTAIEEITEQRAESKVIFDLTGRRVNDITKAGIYIINGKKVLVK